MSLTSNSISGSVVKIVDDGHVVSVRILPTFFAYFHLASLAIEPRFSFRTFDVLKYNGITRGALGLLPEKTIALPA